jgi:hypothetical protein
VAFSNQELHGPEKLVLVAISERFEAVIGVDTS